MSGDTENKERQRQWGCGIAVLMLLPVLYVLGIGPATWLYDMVPPAVQKTLEIMYTPVSVTIKSAGNDSLIFQTLQWYVDFWQ